MGDRDFYSILQVEEHASTARLKRAWLQFAALHPDKGASAEVFMDIHRAYSVLTNKYQRHAYDQWGVEGLKDTQSSISKWTNRHTDKAVFDGIDTVAAHKRQRRAEVDAGANTFGVVLVAINAFRLFGFEVPTRELFDEDLAVLVDPDTSFLAKSLDTKGLSKVQMSRLMVGQSSTFAIGNGGDVLKVSTQILQRRANLRSNVVLGCQHRLHPKVLAEVSANAHETPMGAFGHNYSAAFTYQHDQFTQAALQLAINAEGVAPTLTLTRQMGAGSEGSLSIRSEDGMPAISSQFSHRLQPYKLYLICGAWLQALKARLTGKSPPRTKPRRPHRPLTELHLSHDVDIEPALTTLSTRVAWKILPMTRAYVKMVTHVPNSPHANIDTELQIGTTNKFVEGSGVTVTSYIGLSRRGLGLVFKVKILRCTLMLPIELTPSLVPRALPALLLGAVIPLCTCVWAAHTLSVLAHQRQNRGLLEQAKPSYRRLLRDKLRAIDELRAMQAFHEEVVRHETAVNGLIILRAWLIGPDPLVPDPNFPHRLDVTVATQCLVEGSALQVADGTRFSRLPGLYSPVPVGSDGSQPPVTIAISYEYKGRLYQMTSIDGRGFSLPGSNSGLDGDADDSEDGLVDVSSDDDY